MCNLYSVPEGQTDVRILFRAHHGTRNVTPAKLFAIAMFVLGATSAGAVDALTLTSPDVRQGGRIPDEQVYNGGACNGQNVSPALSWTGAPTATKSFAISMFDPDAGASVGFLRWAERLVVGLFDLDAVNRGGFWHWWAVNIPADVASLPKGAGSGAGLPLGAIQGRSNFDSNNYGGPCPAPGKLHHYEITVYALDLDKLDVDQNTPPAVIGFKVHGHTLAKASLTGVWGR